jgi:leucyl aminopeptidase (aminopeptidase T)
MDHEDDKSAAQYRTYLWGYDATDILRDFTRRCALDVVHLWDDPGVVKRYLETGDEALRAAAYAAHIASAAYAAYAAYAAISAARPAAHDHASTAVAYAAHVASTTAAARAASDADASDAAYVTAVHAAMDKHNRRLTSMITRNRND